MSGHCAHHKGMLLHLQIAMEGDPLRTEFGQRDGV
jgi:hypothetical protein